MNNTTINTTVHTGTFTKADGSQRTMRFVRFSDIPASYRGDKSPRSNGNIETVYDVDAKGYRTFNNDTIVGSLSSSKEVVTFGQLIQRLAGVSARIVSSQEFGGSL